MTERESCKTCLEIKAVKSGGRLMSLDALRGFDMFWIIGGDKIFRALLKNTDVGFLKCLEQQLYHVKWEGFRFYDLVMPLFLFMVGTSIPFSLNKRIKRGDSKKKIYLHIVNRVIVLMVLGMISTGRIYTFNMKLIQAKIGYSILLVMALGYLVGSIVMLNLKIRGQIAAMVTMLLAYWGIIMLVPVPGHGAGVFTMDVNFGFYLNKLILGSLQGGWKVGWILNILTFGSTAILGVLAGELLRSDKSQKQKVLWLLGAGFGCLLVGWIWGHWFPIVKYSWTSSFVLFAGGWSYLLLALFYLIIDVWRVRKWAFGFIVIGMNSIAVYMAARLFDFRNIGNVFVGGLAKRLGPWNDFVQYVAAFVVVWLILYWMYRKKTFIKI